MSKKSDLEMVLGVKVTPESLLCFGTEDGRKLSVKAYAITHVYFKVPEEVDFERCLKDLKFFSSVLRIRKAEDVHYGWDALYYSRITRIVAFDIIWYGEDFFNKRKDAYKSTMHQKIFREYNLNIDDVTVEHLKI
ncbi:hypothetical protein [Hymenobacter jeollabukensis]|uniref:Uncharacterized protein n=1 Tax=Hymenobacter jeollabukensis TaxID=2025313 RepID=A0A5R8WJK0_9BACT|nr:hypothetical protein [Hymenobacter jeollabukensis]TLM88860.1 hypothetical protein FDY95_22015 [Hymenobacter jeollabukensis]